MTEEVIKEVIVVSTPASAEPNSENFKINCTEDVDGNSVPSDLKRKGKPVPNYLRASTGSCHDNCKFGVQHSPEPNKYWPFRRRRQGRADTVNGKQDLDDVTPQKERPRNKNGTLKISVVKDGSAPAKPEFIKPKAPLERVYGHSEISPCAEELPSDEASEPETLSCDAKCLISDDNMACFVDGESSEGAISIELEMPLAIQDSDASYDHIADVILPFEGVRKTGEQLSLDDMSDGSSIKCVSSEKKNIQIVTASEEHEQSKESVKPKAKETSTITRNTASSQKSGRTSHRKISGTSVESSSGPKTMRKKADASASTKLNRDKKFSSTVISAVPKVKEIKVQSPGNAMDPSAKPARLSNLKASTAKNASSPSGPSGQHTDRKLTVKIVARNAHVWQKDAEEKVILSPLKLSRSLIMSAKSLSSIKTRAVMKEKPASPVKSNKKVYGAENAVSDTKEKFLKTASPKVRKTDANKESRSRKEKSATPKTESARVTKSVSVSLITTAQSPRKLTFRRGKVLNLHSNSESNTPRRLRFSPAKTADGSSRSKESTRGRTTRKSDNAASSVSNDSGALQEEVVVLRHQDVKDKKIEQGLFNNVIEETASKLVEMRKSKVKALVGAFETVISLQESKASPAAAAAP